MKKNQLESFLISVEKKAFKRALIATKNENDAIDLVQEAMLKLVEMYSDKNESELLFLFQKILSNKINDWYNSNNNKIVKNISDYNLNDDSVDDEFLDSIATDDFQVNDLLTENIKKETIEIIEKGLEELPDRQKEAFLLRYFQELSISETAEIMKCSEGSVKTHCSRACNTLVSFLKKFGFK